MDFINQDRVFYIRIRYFICLFLSHYSVLVSAGDPLVYSRHQRHQENPGRHHQQPQSEAVAMSGIGEPFFAEDTTMGVKNVTAQLGLTTYLHCKVNNLNGKTVSNTDYRKSLLALLECAY